MRFLRPPALARRALRTAQTDAEGLFWNQLRGRQLAGATFRRQYSFGKYVLDFYCREHRLAIEVDGGQHLTPTGLAQDAQRTAFLQANRVRVLRFNNLEVLDELEGVLAVIANSLSPPGERAGVRGDHAEPEHLELERRTPQPNPLPQGERGQ